MPGSWDAMDVYEATKAVFARVHALDPVNASKIMGMLLIQDGGEGNLIRLAFGPEHLLRSFVAAAKQQQPSSPPPPPVLGPVHTGPTWGRQLQSPAGEYDYDAFYRPAEQELELDCWSPASGGHRRSLCTYYARGHCRNGVSCRFLHGLADDDAAAEREMAAVMRARAMGAFPFSLQQQQESECQRFGGGEDTHGFPAARFDRSGEVMMSGHPAARQIYLTFPSDSTFSEEDVSGYFSMFGPVQDVRIPYQQKRMFGFVTFLYADTVRIILAKGNPHFICDSRVLVKPYKEKAKVPDRFRKMQPYPHHGELAIGAGCTSPTGLLDSRDPFDLHQPQIRPRMMFGNAADHEAFLRRMFDEQQQAADLQRAIEMEGRRFTGLQLRDDAKSRRGGTGHPLSLSSSPIGSPPMMALQQDEQGNGNGVHLGDVTIQDKELNSTDSLAMSAPASSAAASSATDAEVDGDGTPENAAVNPGEAENGESGPDGDAEAAPAIVARGFQECCVEHDMAENGDMNKISPYHVASSLFPPTSNVELPLYNSCFFQVPRFSSGHEAIGL